MNGFNMSATEIKKLLYHITGAYETSLDTWMTILEYDFRETFYDERVELERSISKLMKELEKSIPSDER